MDENGLPFYSFNGPNLHIRTLSLPSTEAVSLKIMSIETSIL